MSSIKSTKETRIKEDEKGNITKNTVEKTIKIEKSNEPDYIKLYTNTWCEFNKIPVTWRPLFLELITRMTYCNTRDLKNSQIVQTGSIFGDSIKESLNIGQRQYQKGLKALTECDAIRKIENKRGIYQINPNYAGRGEWKYNPKYARGGIEDLKATFDFVNHTVETNIKWAEDGKENELNEIYREMLNSKSEDNITIKSQKINKIENE